MKKLIFLTLIFLVISNLCAQTEVSGGIANQTWTPSGSPYIVVGDIIIGGLTIDPGVTVRFNGDYVFEIAGVLTAVGTEQDSIIFTKANNIEGWQGIYFNQSVAGSQLSYCKIEGSINSGIRIENTTSGIYPAINNCLITNNSISGKEIGGGGIKINGIAAFSNCTISNNLAYAFFDASGVYYQGDFATSMGGGIYATGKLILDNCIIIANSAITNAPHTNASVADSYGGGIYSEGQLSLINCIILNNILEAHSLGSNPIGGSTSRCYGGGVYITGSSELSNCIISSNSLITSVSGSGTTDIKAGGGIYTKSGNFKQINCTIAYNLVNGIENGSASSNIFNSILYFNEQSQIDGTINTTFSNIQGGYEGEGNIDFNPIFKNKNSLIIIDGSPCIDAGNPDPSYYDILLPPSLGTEINDIGATGGPSAANWKILPDQRLLDISPYSINFGNVSKTTTTVDTLKIINNGVNQLNINSIQLTGTDADKFSTETSLFSLGQNELKALLISFIPDVSKNYLAYLRIDSNNGKAIVPLAGIGGFPQISTATQILDFGNVVIDRYKEVLLKISNLGIDQLNISDISVDNSTFSAVEDSIDIPAEQDYDLAVRFSPTIGGLVEGTLIIRSNDSSNDPYLIALKGTGVPKPPPARFSFNPVQSFEYHKEVELRVNITNAVITGTTVYLRVGGKISYEEFQMTNISGSTWSTTIPENRITERGVEYYLEAFHNNASTFYPDVINPRIVPFVGIVNITKVQFPYKTLANDYQMLSIPIESDKNSLQEIMVDNLGKYDNKKYRLYDWDALQEKYVELDSLELKLNPGRSIWLITRDRKSIDVDSCFSISTAENYSIQLQKGWNFIGSPFAFNVSWDGILAINSALQIQGNALYYYTGKSWESSSTLEPFRGYAVKAISAGTMSIEPVEDENSLEKTAISEKSWHIQIKAQNGQYNDEYNFAGANNTANDNWDFLDIPEPPPMGKYVSVYFDHSDWEKGKGFYSGDYREINHDGYIFDFVLNTNISEPTILEIIPKNMPEEFSWSVFSDETSQEFTQGKISTTLDKQTFHLIIGTNQYLNNKREEFQAKPVNFLLMQNYPNPFNPSTKINFSIPQRAFVTLKVYDIMGREVATLIKEQREKGSYQIDYNAKELSSGLYIYQMRADNFEKIKKMLFIK